MRPAGAQKRAASRPRTMIITALLAGIKVEIAEFVVHVDRSRRVCKAASLDTDQIVARLDIAEHKITERTCDHGANTAVLVQESDPCIPEACTVCCQDAARDIHPCGGRYPYFVGTYIKPRSEWSCLRV